MRGVIFGVVSVLLLLALGTAGYFYFQLQQVTRETQQVRQEATQEAASGVTKEQALEEIKKVEDKVRQIVLLPEGETPTLVRIKDVNDLTDNKEFFKDAKNGDEVLVYEQAKKAFLYRPSEHKLINFAYVNMAADSPTPLPTVAGTSDKLPVTRSGKVLVEE